MAKSFKYITLGLLTAGLFGASLNAIAASSPIAELPSSAFYMQLDTTKTHPFKGQLKDFMDQALEGSEKELIAKLLSANIESTTIGFSQNYNQSTGNSIYMMAFAITQTDFNNITSAADESELTTENLGLGRFIYTVGDDFFFTYKDGNLVAANQKGLIHDLLFTSNSDSLSKNADYQNFISKIKADSFLTGYIDYNKMIDASPELTSWLSSEGFAFNQTAQGFGGKLYIHFQPSVGLDASKYTFSPALYAKVNPENLIFFQESNNLSGHIADLTKMMKDPDMLDAFAEMNTGFAENTGINLSDLKPFFSHRYAFAVHRDPSSAMHMPAFSFLTEVKGQESDARMMMAKFEKALETHLDQYNEETSSKTTYAVKSINWESSDFQQLTLTQPAYVSEYSPEFDTPAQTYTITYGVTADGLLIITTLPSPSTLYALNGLTNDTGWKEAYNGQSLTDVSVLNFANLHALIKDFPRSEISDSVDQFFAPLHYLTASTTGSLNSYWMTFNLDLDISKLSTYADAFHSVFEDFSRIAPDIQEEVSEVTDGWENSSTFVDVHSSDWFSPYVMNLHLSNIMNGYGNEFRPNQPITRAEFLKTLIEAMRINGMDLKEAKYSTNFTDVDGSAWYSAYINTARSNSLVKGYADGSVHPNAQISRAEAMQILANATTPGLVPSGSNNRPFSDVHSSDWFYGAVYNAFDAGYVNGKTSNMFAPNDSLTRAETAKIISNYFGY